MRHKVYGKKLGRNKNERTALFKSLVQELFIHGHLTTSEAKAKAIKGLVDKVINQAKSKNSKNLIKSFFANKLVEERVLKDIAPKMQNRTSGYTSSLRLGVREGDRTMVVKMSLIGIEELKPLEKVTSDKRQETSKKTEKVEKEVAKLAPVKKPAVKKVAAKRKVSK